MKTSTFVALALVVAGLEMVNSMPMEHNKKATGSPDPWANPADYGNPPPEQTIYGVPNDPDPKFKNKNKGKYESSSDPYKDVNLRKFVGKGQGGSGHGSGGKDPKFKSSLIDKAKAQREAAEQREQEKRERAMKNAGLGPKDS